MSHALVLVALSPEDIAEAKGDKELAVSHQMAPFEEADWFSDGSRWDWWIIGGRFSGMLGKNIFEKREQPSVETCRALLHDRTWNEGGRMGWFGCKAATECELVGKDKASVCSFVHEDMDAKIVTHNGGWDEAFQELYRSLPEDTTLVVVDYHV